MPGFGQTPTAAAPFLGAMLTSDQIKQIVYYERYCLESTTYLAVSPTCDLGPSNGMGPRTNPTTTTTAAKKKG